jgi:hypothetical protein
VFIDTEKLRELIEKDAERGRERALAAKALHSTGREINDALESVQEDARVRYQLVGHLETLTSTLQRKSDRLGWEEEA